ncbi:MAG TPA: ribokinase [Luteimonas sp.]|nr:ribokinase [Luteimonas sp.]
MSARGSVLVAGSANLDFVVRAAHVPAPGETILGRELATFPGGKGANQAVACARAGGAATRMLLALGDDASAAPIEASLREAGVDLHLVRAQGVSTGSAFICIADDGENAITVAPGANATLRADQLPTLAGVRYLLMQLETPLDAVAAWARAARDAGIGVVLNAAPAQPLPAALLATVDLLVVNEGELGMLTGIRGDLAAALAALPDADVVVTLGALGACARVGGTLHLQPGFAVDVVDTTAAGDTFCGVLVAALAQDTPVPAALRQACAASALACTQLGAQASIPDTAAVDALLAAHPADAATARDALERAVHGASA